LIAACTRLLRKAASRAGSSNTTQHM
jgi:hypothetical protein